MDIGVFVKMFVWFITIVLQVVDGLSIAGLNKNIAGWQKGRQLGKDYLKETPDSYQNKQYMRDVWLRHQQDLNKGRYEKFIPLKSIISKYYYNSPSTLRQTNQDNDTNRGDIENYIQGNLRDNAENFPRDVNFLATITYPDTVALKETNENIPSSSSKIGMSTVPVKRQQGWYVQYGKRTGKDQLEPFTKPIISDELSKSTFRNKMDQQNGWLEKIRLDFDFDRHAHDFDQQEEDDPRMLMRSIAFELSPRTHGTASKESDSGHNLLTKRQQGWFTQYGKRSKTVGDLL